MGGRWLKSEISVFNHPLGCMKSISITPPPTLVMVNQIVVLATVTNCKTYRCCCHFYSQWCNFYSQWQNLQVLSCVCTYVSFVTNCKSYITDCKSDNSTCKFRQILQSRLTAIQLTVTRDIQKWGATENVTLVKWFQSPPTQYAPWGIWNQKLLFSITPMGHTKSDFNHHPLLWWLTGLRFWWWSLTVKVDKTYRCYHHFYGWWRNFYISDETYRHCPVCTYVSLVTDCKKFRHWL